MHGERLILKQKINVPEEAIELVGTSETDAAGLPEKLSEEEPRYAFFRYRRKVEGREDGDVVFIYTCPPRSNVKERMVYACSVRGVMAAANKEAGLEVTKRVSYFSVFLALGSMY
jgi:twinfilin-like protein